MTHSIQSACDYLSFLYEMTYQEKGDLLFIKNQNDIFKFNLTDKERFGYYTLYHKNKPHNIPGYHIQLKASSIYKILFFAFGHDFHLKCKIWITNEDIKRLIEDIKEYDLYNERK